MKNAILRTILSYLKEDNSSKDLVSPALETTKTEIIQKYQKDYNINPAHITNEYWNSVGRTHLKSLQTLLGDTTSDWYKNKFSFIDEDFYTSILPLITISCSDLEIQNYSNSPSYTSNVFLKINTLSKKDSSLGEAIAFRIKNLVLNAKIAQEICLVNGLVYLQFQQDFDIANKTTDVLNLRIKIITNFLEI